MACPNEDNLSRNHLLRCAENRDDVGTGTNSRGTVTTPRPTGMRTPLQKKNTTLRGAVTISWGTPPAQVSLMWRNSKEHMPNLPLQPASEFLWGLPNGWTQRERKTRATNLWSTLVGPHGWRMGGVGWRWERVDLDGHRESTHNRKHGERSN